MIASTLGLGTWGFGGESNIEGTALGWRELPRRQIEATIRAAIDVGINFFDTSDFYGDGRAEELLGESLVAEKDVIVATKGGLIPKFVAGTTDIARNFSPEYIENAVHRSLKRLKRDHIDLYQLHGPDISVCQHDDIWDLLERLVDKGKIRFFGVSLGSRSLEFGIWARRKTTTVQTRYSLLHPEEIGVIERWGIQEPFVIARSIFEHGLIFDKYSGASRFAMSDHRGRKLSAAMETTTRLKSVLSKAPLKRNYSLSEAALLVPLGCPNVCVVLCGATSPEHVLQNAKIVAEVSMDSEDREIVLRIAQQILPEEQKR